MFVGFIHARPGYHLVSLGSLGRTLGGVGFILELPEVGGFIPIRWVYSGEMSGTFRFIRLNWTRLTGRWFIWVRCVLASAPRGLIGLFGRALAGVRFIRACPAYRRVHWGSLGSLERAIGVVGIIRARSRSRRVHW